MQLAVFNHTILIKKYTILNTLYLCRLSINVEQIDKHFTFSSHTDSQASTFFNSHPNLHQSIRTLEHTTRSQALNIHIPISRSPTFWASLTKSPNSPTCPQKHASFLHIFYTNTPHLLYTRHLYTKHHFPHTYHWFSIPYHVRTHILHKHTTISQ